MPTEIPTTTSSQTWLTAITGIAAALGAVLAKKRFTRQRHPAPVTGHSPLVTLEAKLDANHKELLSALAAQSTLIDKRLDALESAVARLDERTKILSTFATSIEVPIHQSSNPSIH